MGEHTPGPWRRANDGRIVANTSRGTRDIAVVVVTNNNSEEAAANARTIIAAPDLLTALKTVVAQIEDYERVNNLAPNPGRKHCWDSVASAHDVIAKAEGRQ